DVGRCTESIDAEALRITCHPIRAIADEPRAEQRRGVLVVVSARQVEAETLISDRLLCVPAVDLVPGVPRVAAKVLAIRAAVLALAAGASEPRNNDAIARCEASDARTDVLDAADDLVSRNDRDGR